MTSCVSDENGQRYGWGRVLDYCGIEWRADKKVDEIINSESEE